VIGVDGLSLQFCFTIWVENKRMNDIRNFWNSGPAGKMIILGVGLLVLCCVCTVPLLVFSPGTSILAPVETAVNLPTQVVISTQIILPTNTPVINTPEIINTAELILTDTPQVSTPDTGCAFCNLECPVSQEGIDFCVANPQLVADQPLFEATLRTYCDSKGTDFCKVLVWTDRQYLPSSLPMTEEQLSNEVADYSRNKTTGGECFLLLAAGEVLYQSEGCFS
jgi:hypothetical protein